MKIAYLVNQYPKISHSFIRREILALERQGYDVQRLAMRGWADELRDEEDVRERAVTRYVLQDGAFAMGMDVVRMALTRPGRLLKALALACKIGMRSDRPLPLHLIYLAEACRIVPWMAAHGARHLHAHFGTNSTEVAMLANILGGPSYSFTVHGPEEFDKPEFLWLAEKIRRSAFVVGVSSFGRSQLFRWAAATDWPKVQVVHCGIDPDFHAVPVRPIPAAPRLVCVGRLCEQKGQMLLVHAVKAVVARGLAIHLVLAGDGEMRPAIEALIAESGLQDHISITGWIDGDRVREEMLSARALVLPSFAEGLPVVVMEAMALRRPVLSTFIAGIPELVRTGETGWLFPAGDVDELSKMLEVCLSTSPEQLQAMGEAGYRRVLERHAIDTEAAKLSRLINATLA
ncbi:glycosyltransferase [Oxalobacteraceae sp. CFBP 13708]|nr:glycosyltransferase [Oxalobacteraceae sp. CFBP 8761]MBD8725963.1 glycosyltransferase [Oxalobacteraceae sp. CFBP 13708]